MFRFTIRDVLWLATSLVLSCGASRLSHSQQASTDNQPAAVPLESLAKLVMTARVQTLPLNNFNPLARDLSIPEQTTSQNPVYSVSKTVEGITHGIIVRRMTDPVRTDVIVFAVRGDALHIFHTGPDGVLQSAITRNPDHTTRTVSVRDSDAAFREEVRIWLAWEKDYLKQQAEKDKAEPNR
jgi:hypothetical protein